MAEPVSHAQASERFIRRLQVGFDSVLAIGEMNSEYSY
jgi:hypothetical protein